MLTLRAKVLLLIYEIGGLFLSSILYARLYGTKNHFILDRTDTPTLVEIHLERDRERDSAPSAAHDCVYKDPKEFI